jgi:uncharacterized protein YdgA (DUF945 family)
LFFKGIITMNKKLWSALIGAGIIGASMGGIWYSRQETESRFDQFHELIQPKNNMIVSAIRTKKNMGFLTSTIETTYRIGCGHGQKPLFADKDTEFKIIHHIKSLPWGTKINSEIQFPESLQKEFAEVFKGKHPIKISTIKNIFRDVQTHISLDPIIHKLTNDLGELHWKGINASFTYDQKLDHISTDLRFNGLDLGDDNYKISLGALVYHNESKKHIVPIQNPEWKKEGKEISIYLGDDILSWNGLSLSTKNNDQPNNRNIFNVGLIGSIAMKSRMNFDTNKKNIAFSGDYSFNKIRYNNILVTDQIKGNISAQGLNTEALAYYNEKSWNNILSCQIHQESEELDSLLLMIKSILIHNPSAQFSMDVIRDTLKANTYLDIKTSGITLNDLETGENTSSIQEKILLKAGFNLPEKLIEQIVHSINPHKEEAEKIMLDINMMVRNLMQGGYLTIENQEIKSSISLNKGKLEVLGKELPTQ